LYDLGHARSLSGRLAAGLHCSHDSRSRRPESAARCGGTEALTPMAAPPVAHVSLLLALVLVAAKLGGETATRLRQPPVLGELLAGVLLGNLPWSTLRNLGTDPTVDMLSQLGVLILLFDVGLESTVREVLSVGVTATRVAVLGTMGSFAAGFAAAVLL